MCPTGSHVEALAHSLWWSAGRLGTLGVGTSQRKWVTRGKTLKFTSISSLFSMSCPLWSEQPPSPHAPFVSDALPHNGCQDTMSDWLLWSRESKQILPCFEYLCQAPIRDKKTREQVFTTSEYHLPWIYLRHVWTHRFLQYYCVEML